MLSENKKLELFGKNIAKMRKSKGLSQNKLADILDVSREHIAKIETSKRGMSLSLIFRLCNALEIPESLIFDFEED